ncbi:aldo/keto reductase [Brevibacillus nitrificans]
MKKSKSHLLLDEESIQTVHRALEFGGTFLDTADTYGNGHND